MKDIFKNIGLNDLETNVYLELIKIGPQVASTIANRLHINRSNIYSVLRSLFLKGLITYFQKDKVKVFSANDPNCLVAYLDRRSRTYDYYKNEILSVIPSIRSLSKNKISKKPVVRYLEGLESINTLLFQLTSSSNPLKGYLGFNYSLSIPIKKFWFNFFDSNLFNIDDIKLIIPNCKKLKSFFTSFSRTLNISINTNTFHFDNLSENLTFLVDSKVIIINFKPNSEYCIVIESEDLYTFYTLFFDKVWFSLNSAK